MERGPAQKKSNVQDPASFPTTQDGLGGDIIKVS